jgi:CRISPR-associated protein Cas2
MARIANYVVVYDVSADRERRHVARLLTGFGARVQRSAFECRLSERSRKQLLRLLDELQLATGCVFLYRQQWGAARRCAGVVQSNPVADAQSAFFL